MLCWRFPHQHGYQISFMEGLQSARGLTHMDAGYRSGAFIVVILIPRRSGVGSCSTPGRLSVRGEVISRLLDPPNTPVYLGHFSTSSQRAWPDVWASKSLLRHRQQYLALQINGHNLA